jgi:hypothetical protein
MRRNVTQEVDMPNTEVSTITLLDQDMPNTEASTITLLDQMLSQVLTVNWLCRKSSLFLEIGNHL